MWSPVLPLDALHVNIGYQAGLPPPNPLHNPILLFVTRNKSVQAAIGRAFHPNPHPPEPFPPVACKIGVFSSPLYTASFSLSFSPSPCPHPSPYPLPVPLFILFLFTSPFSPARFHGLFFNRSNSLRPPDTSPVLSRAFT